MGVSTADAGSLKNMLPCAWWYLEKGKQALKGWSGIWYLEETGRNFHKWEFDTPFPQQK